MPEFIAVCCCDCKMWQVTQRRKAQGKLQISKWDCKLCGKKQSVQHVAGSSFSASDLRPLVQDMNMKKKDAPQEEKVESSDVRVRVFVPFSSDWDALLSSSSSSEEGEAVLLYRQQEQKRARKSGGKKSIKKIAVDEQGFVKPAPIVIPQQQQQQKNKKVEQHDDDEEGDDGAMFVRDDSSKYVAVEDEVWRDPDE